MKEALQVTIPTPCHENWNKMNPTEQGRFCLSCNKQVVDFSLMSDKEVFQFFSNYSGNTCGRFSDEQLNRNITSHEEIKKSRWLHYVLRFMFPAFLISNKAGAQTKGEISSKLIKDSVVSKRSLLAPTIEKELIGKTYSLTIISANNSNSTPVVITSLGGVASQFIKKPKKAIVSDTIKGKIFYEDGTTIPFASIQIKGTNNGMAANAEGEFAIPVKGTRIVLIFSSVGTETKEIEFDLEKRKATDVEKVVMQLSKNNLQGDVIVSGYSRRTTGLLVCTTKARRINIIDTIKNIITKPSLLKVFPNPAQHNSVINLQLNVTDLGEYQMMITNVAGQLLMQKSFNVIFKQYTEPVSLPANIAAGEYFIKVVCVKTKKSYSSKIIVQ